jgi:hypothetical protein
MFYWHCERAGRSIYLHAWFEFLPIHIYVFIPLIHTFLEHS